MSRFWCCRYVSTTLSHRKHPLRSRVSGQQMSFARKRECNVAAAEGFVCVKAQRQQKILDCAKAKRQQRVFFVRKRSDGNNNSTMLVTKALSQDVMILAFVPLSLIPKESPSLHSNHPINVICNFNDESNLKTLISTTGERYLAPLYRQSQSYISQPTYL